MTDTFDTSFAGDKVIANATDHHIFVAAIIGSVNANPEARQIFIDLANIDPNTKRAYYDIGNRADNSLTVLSAHDASNVYKNGNHLTVAAPEVGVRGLFV